MLGFANNDAVASRGGDIGRRRAARAAGPRPLRRALTSLLAALVVAVGWVYLVLAAIDLGRNARADSDTQGWVFTVIATLGAALSLLLVFLLLMRARDAWSTRRPRARGRHR